MQNTNLKPKLPEADTAKLTRDQWAAVYDLCYLQEAGISRKHFLENPWRILREQGQGQAVASIRSGFLPLLPAQAAIVLRLDAANDTDAEVAGVTGSEVVTVGSGAD